MSRPKKDESIVSDMLHIRDNVAPAFYVSIIKKKYPKLEASEIYSVMNGRSTKYNVVLAIRETFPKKD